GDISYEMVVSDASAAANAEAPAAAAAIADQAQKMFAGIKGMSCTGTLSSRGADKGMDVKMPEGADPQIRQTMDRMKGMFANLASVLPEEPVGSGAKWEVKRAIKSEGLTVDETVAYQLVSNEGDHVVTKQIITQSAANQKIKSP